MDATKIKNIERKEVNYYSSKKEPVNYSSDNLFYGILKNWIDYLEKNEYSELGIYLKKRQMIYLLEYLEKTKLTEINQITRKIILDYMSTFPKYYRKATLKVRHKELRVILRFFYNQKYTNEDLSIIVPSIKTNHLENIPSIWIENDLKKLFDNIDTATSSGKKLYAILLLALKYGIRVGDIKSLKFENIDWKNRKISFIQSKTKTELEFPLLSDVSDAIIDYIKNARPASKEKIIFLNKKGQKIGASYNFHREIKAIMKKANIEINKLQKKGIHSLRHTLASALLKKDVSYYIISSILGHNNNDSTFIYAKIDQNKLIQCCLELSEVKI